MKFSRWRRTHGFGVHSPFAFHFITRVIGETSAAYYAYAEIDALCPRGRHSMYTSLFGGRDFSIPEARLLFRVLCYFHPARIIELGNGMEVTNTIIRRALPQAKTELWTPTRSPALADDGSNFLLINDVPADAFPQARAFILQALTKGAVTFGRNHSHNSQMMQMWRECTAAMPRGMSFTNDEVGICVARDGLPRQDFRLIF